MGRIRQVNSYLADTQIVLWSWHNDRRLRAAHAAVLRSDAKVFVSIASVWEIAIKAGLGKLKTVENVGESLGISGFEVLPIELRHAEALRHLPRHHGDPFDRMLIAQAQLDKMTILTSDRHFALYDVALA